jgi:hypothetical protein
MFNETHEAHLMDASVPSGEQQTQERLYEAKLIHQFDHRFASYRQGMSDPEASELSSGEKLDPHKLVTTRYFVTSAIWDSRVAAKGHTRDWILAFRQITNATNERTSIFSFLPRCSSMTSLPVVSTNAEPPLVLCLAANLNSFLFDFVTRTRVAGTHLNHFIVHQLPVVPPFRYRAIAWFEFIRKAALELTYTAWDLEGFAQDCGWSGPPFRWDDERRFLLRCELDAAFFHLYLGTEDEWRKQPAALTQSFPTPRDAVAYIMDTFPIVKRKDEEKFNGNYRTKRTVLEIYDTLADCMRSGKPHTALTTPIPASFRVIHRPRLPSSQRQALANAEKFLLVFIDAFLKQTHQEATFQLLDSVFHLLRHRTNHALEFEAAVGESAKAWLSTYNDTLPNKEFLPFLRRLESDGWIEAHRATGRLNSTEKFPSIPFDAWRNFDVSAALRVITELPDIVKLVVEQPDTPLAAREFAALKVG